MSGYFRRDGKPVLAVSNRELLATDYYRKSPHSEKQWVKARRQAGVDEMLSQQGMEQAISVTMTDVDIYQNNITLFTNKFVSPLSSLGPSFYKYYLMDTLTVAGKPCVDLTFVPFQLRVVRFYGTFIRHAGQYLFCKACRHELSSENKSELCGLHED